LSLDGKILDVPFTFKDAGNALFELECGTFTSGNNALLALRILVSISEMGSFIVITSWPW
jgi:hypothetical protein